MNQNNLVLIFFLSLIICCEEKQEIQYPLTNRNIIENTYFDVVVEDPYQWMENDQSSDVEEWINKQNQLSYNYLNNIPYKERIRKRLEEIWDYTKIGTPFIEGEYTPIYIKIMAYKINMYYIGK